MHISTLRLRAPLCLAALLVCQATCLAQTEFDFTTTSWLPFFPDYKASSIVTPGGGTVLQENVFQDDQVELSRGIGLQAYHHFGNGRRMLEFDMDVAWIDGMGSTSTVADPGMAGTVWFPALNGGGFLSTPNGESVNFNLDSEVVFYSEYIGFRQCIDSRFGPLNLGIGFGHMAFEQDFVFNGVFSNGPVGQYREGLDTDYLGGEIRGTRSRAALGRPLLLDFGVGLYDMDSDYAGTTTFFNPPGTTIFTDNVTGGIRDLAVKVDLGVRTQKEICDVMLKPGIGFRYISSMPEIVHPQTITPVTPVSISTDAGFFLSSTLEICL